MVRMETKKCFKCAAIKPLTDFYKHPMMADGHVNKCKECNKKDVQKNYRSNIEYYKEYDKKRPRRIGPIERGKKMRAFWELSRDIKRQATRIASNAIRDGRLIPGPCRVCGTTERIEAHHNDYTKPLEVDWLCVRHHMEIHGKVMRKENPLPKGPRRKQS